MSNDKIDNILNPYLVFRVDFLNSEEELVLLEDKAKNLVDDKFYDKYVKNCLKVELTPNLGYIFIKQNFFDEFLDMTRKCNYKFTLTDSLQYFWETKDLEMLKDEDPAPEVTKELFPDEITPIEILKQLFELKYNSDDVLDKISKFGEEQLNELNIHILNK